jgi:hypothetical protein
MGRLSRRSFLATGAGGGLVAATGGAHSVLAEPATSAPIPAAQGANVPFYRARLGSADLTIVSDGTIGFPPTTLLPDVPEDELEGFLVAHHQPTDRVPLQLNAMVVDLNGRRVVVDTGCGGKFDPTAGRLPDHMEAAGLDPATVDAAIVTHLHPDHLWGATDAENEAPAFANAEIVVPEAELHFWKSMSQSALQQVVVPQALDRETSRFVGFPPRGPWDRVKFCPDSACF